MSAVVTGCTTKGKKMAKFKQVSQPFLFGKVMGFWSNMVKNYDGNVRNDDFFNVISRNFDHDRAVELIEAAYSKKSLDDMKKARSRDCRLDLSDSLDSIFQSFWNTDKANAKCRIILEGIKDCIDGEKQGGDEDPLEKRFAELKRLLRLSDLESEILLLAYVKYETCLVWPRRVESREMAEKSWQVSQVNELLQQMENFDGVMVAATNFCKNLDPAIMRRFTFKLEFDYLDDEGKRLFFERMFKTRLTEEEFAELKTLQNLAPGDFRTVRQEQFYLADEQTNWDRIEALKEECAVKKDGNKTARIGFAA